MKINRPGRNIDTGSGNYYSSTSTNGGMYIENYRGEINPQWTKLPVSGNVNVRGNVYECPNGDRYTDGKVL